MIGTLIQGRVSVGGAAISAAKTALTIAIRWALVRRQFGPPGGAEEAVLLDYRAHQRRLLPALARTYALHFAQRHLVDWFHTAFTAEDYPERERRELETMAAGLKAMSTWHATRTIQTCREACGGAGYLAENRFAALKADTDVFTTFEGDNTILMQLVAKSLLTDYRDQFGDLNPLGMVGFVAGEVVETVVERLATRKIFERLVDIVPVVGDDDPDVLDRGDHIALFSWREEHIISSLARRLRRGIDDGNDPFAVFNECQDHVLVAARAHIERVILECFVASIGQCEDEGVKATLNRLCDIYALGEIERDRGWFQEHERIGSARSKAITRTVNELCGELREDARSLIDAFAIPELQLGDGIARAR